MVVCALCGKELQEEEIYAFYPEDSTYICKKCFRKNTEKENKKKEK